MGLCWWCPYLNKWWTFTASIGVALCSGLTYTFAIWGGELKHSFGLSQSQLELIASASNIGGYSGIFAGLVYDALLQHKRFGPRIVLALGCALNAFGYLGLWAALKGLFAAKFWHLVVLAAVAANAGSWLDATIMATNVRNFPSSRGTVVGVLKAAIGLSGSLFASIYSGLFLPNRAPFVLCLALVPAAVGLLALPLVNTCTFVQVCELETGRHVFTTEGRFLFALQTLGALAVYLISGATLSSLHPLTDSMRLTLTAGAGVLLLPLLLIPHGSGGLLSQKATLHHSLSMYEQGEEGEEGEGEEEGEQGRAAGGDEEAGGHGAGSDQRAAGTNPLTQPLLAPGGMQRAGGNAATSAMGAATRTSSVHSQQRQRLSGPPMPPAPPAFPELSPAQCLRSTAFWLLFAALTISMGSGLTLLNNLSQLVKALSGRPQHDTPILVSIFSVSNCAGRMALGYVPETLLHSRGTPRLLFLPLLSALMSAACLALAFARLPALYALAALTGFAFGGHWTLFPSLVSELFGLARFAANYCLAQLAPAVGSVAFAMGLAGWLYDRALHRHGSKSTTCIGQDCFQLTFLVLAGLGLLATACATALYRLEAAPLYRVMEAEVHSYDEEVHRPARQPRGLPWRRRGARSSGSP